MRTRGAAGLLNARARSRKHAQSGKTSKLFIIVRRPRQCRRLSAHARAKRKARRRIHYIYIVFRGLREFVCTNKPGLGGDNDAAGVEGFWDSTGECGFEFAFDCAVISFREILDILHFGCEPCIELCTLKDFYFYEFVEESVRFRLNFWFYVSIFRMPFCVIFSDILCLNLHWNNRKLFTSN